MQRLAALHVLAEGEGVFADKLHTLGDAYGRKADAAHEGPRTDLGQMWRQEDLLQVHAGSEGIVTDDRQTVGQDDAFDLGAHEGPTFYRVNSLGEDDGLHIRSKTTTFLNNRDVVRKLDIISSIAREDIG